MLTRLVFIVIALPGVSLAQAPAEFIVGAEVTRESFQFDSLAVPKWRVELKYRNQLSTPVTLGPTLIMVAPGLNMLDSSEAFVTRESQAAGNKRRWRTLERHRIGFGVEVRPEGSTFWPFVLPGMSTRTAFMAFMKSPLVEAFPGGGYGSPIAPGEERNVTENVYFPFDSEIKGERQEIIVVPPAIQAAESKYRIAQRLLFFDVKGVPAVGTKFTLARQEILPDDPSQLAGIASDLAVPLWRRLLALNRLAEAFPREAASTLIRLARDTANVHVQLQAAAIANLGFWKLPGALPVLQEAVGRTDASTNVARLTAITAIGDLGDAAGAEALRALAVDNDHAVARMAIESLTLLKDEKSAPLFRGALIDGRRELRREAADGLVTGSGQVGRNAAIGLLNDRKAKEHVRELLASAVGAAEADWAAAAIAAIAVDEQDKEPVRVAAIYALRKFKTPEAAAAIQKAAQSSKKKVRAAASQTR